MHAYENHAALCVNWQMYGTSSILPGHLLIEDLVYKYEKKIKRREGWADGASLVRANNLNAVVDTSIHKVCPEVKE